MPATREIHTTPTSGAAMLALALTGGLASSVAMVIGAAREAGFVVLAGVLGLAVSTLIGVGLFMVTPNTARVVQLFGDYQGTVTDVGLRWLNPFTTKATVSLRAHTLNGDKLKVNDLTGNPIEIAAVVVWRVQDTAKALFDVEDFASFVRIQSETAVRHLASTHPYDSHGEGSSLRGSADQINAELAAELSDRLKLAGIEVIEARLAHLAYAPEIASAMLRRQQAEAVLAARQRIVEGAVGMVQLALDQLSERGVVTLDEERKASMVSNLLVVLCAETSAQPVVNTGTLYHG